MMERLRNFRDFIISVLYVAICTVIILLMISPFIHAKVYPLMLERNWYADEVVFHKDSWVFGTNSTLKTKWGALLADEVNYYLTEEQTDNPGSPAVRARINYIQMDEEWISIPPYPGTIVGGGERPPTKYNLSDAQYYASRVASYINTRQLSEVCKAKSNQLWFTYPDARSSGYSLIWNLHSLYPYVHVVNQSYGYSFEKP